jgi:crossover junction endodeoxyribonuclease RuvC
MILISIDPGFDRLGLAVISKEKGTKEILLHSECFTTNKKDVFTDRLCAVGFRLSELIRQYQPDIVALESLFIEKNQKTAMHVSETRGVLLYIAAQSGARIVEYTPLQIKVAVTGYGKSDKSHVMSMVPRLIAMSTNKTSDDELDAIAVGLTAIAYEHL